MRASKIAVRAALVCSAAGIACAIWSAVDETPARAADRGTGLLPATVDLAGDLADAPVRAVEKPLHRVTKLARPAPAPVRKAVEPVERVLDAAVDTVQSATKTSPPTPPPTAAPPKQLLAPDTKPAAEPAPKAVPAVVLLTGPVPGTVTLDPTRADTTAPVAAAALPCGDDTTEPPRPGHVATREGSGPCIPDGRDTLGGFTAVKPPTKTGADQLAATTPTGPATLALRLLGELLPRSDLPTGRAEHPEPGPA